ncbi:hypothetical protein BKP37_02550 [Anaerobacillus alkalilacustris]|uniref:Uncharacterized protein n=1 Tax=Anaerobacillus alkalilacustris TaxID=393763 RepID=A0A1S2LYW9_9BACI|nr:HD domain-containing phosphohydrolase [Anaerobacillus alkalilacustris]OIJ17403.1 hypothetical protein BKP37_02550 [Anaerobacillus alkalilacustris]
MKEGKKINNLILKVIDNWQKPKGSFLLISVFFLSFLVFLSWGIVYITGGTKYVYLHLMYIPIVFAAFLFRVWGGIITAIVAGVLLGPLMPLDVENNIQQPFIAYIYRTIFFLIIGVLVGFMAKWLNIRLLKIKEVLGEISLVYAHTLKNYAEMVAVRDEQTSFHCERVAYNAYLLGREVGLDVKKLESLYWSGLLHDLGKIGIKEAILLKPGKLTDEEFNEIKLHTEIGYKLLTSLSPKMEEIAQGVRSHHEKWDGSGYPDKLKQDQIPIFGRILCIIDVFEALTSERPYKDAWDPNDAINFLEKNKNAYFDPELVGIFKRLYYEGKVWVGNNTLVKNEVDVPRIFNNEQI